jgi:Peptidase family M23
MSLTARLSLTRRAFFGVLTVAAPGIANAGRGLGLQSSNGLDVAPLDEWTVVDTTSGRHLAGELLVKNSSGAPAQLIELRLGGPSAGQPLVRLSGPDLQSRLAHVANGNLPTGSLTLAPGSSALLFLWDHIPSGAAIQSAALDFTAAPDTAHRTIPISLRTPLAEPQLVWPPLGGGPWVALYDPHMPRGHRRVAFARGSRQVVPARFAIDWVRLDQSGRPTDAAATDLGRWYGFGVDVLAVADAKVVAVRDSYPDVLTPERPAKWTDDDVSGNYVGLELASRRFAFYEHLQRGSVRVKVGDSVRAGQPIARLGRSGVNSAGPHLHFHVGSDPSTIDSQGRPYALSQFRILGQYPSMATALSSTPWSPVSGSNAAKNVLPEPGTVVEFD